MGWLSRLTGRAAATGVSDAARRAPVPPQATGPAVPGWRELPVLQRFVAEPELMTDPVGFSGSLNTWHDASFHTPLGHLVSREAPSGLVHGLAAVEPDGQAPQDVPPPVTHLPAPAAPGAAVGTGRRSAVPLQRTADTGSLVSAQPLERSPRTLRPLRHTGADAGAPVWSEGSAGGAVPTAPVQRSAGSDGFRPREPDPVDDTGSRPAPGLGLGLGAPLTGLPSTARRGSAASAAAPPAVSSRREQSVSTTQGPAETAAQRVTSTSPAPRPSTGSGPGGPLGHPRTSALRHPAETGPPPADEPVAARTAEPVSTSSASAGTSGPRTPVRLQRATMDGTPSSATAAPAPGPVVPLVTQRSVPLYSGVRYSGQTPADGRPSAGAVPVRWEPAPSASTGETRLHDQHGPVPDTSVQRAITAPPAALAPSHATPPRPRIRPHDQPHRTAPAVQRAAPAAFAAGLADAGAAAVAAGVARRMADGSVVFRPPAVQRDTGPEPSATDSGTGETPPDPPEPAATPPPEPPPEPTPGPGPDPGEGSGPPDSVRDADDGGNAPAVTDELIRALFAPLSRLLKAELRLDRERAGFLIDTRH